MRMPLSAVPQRTRIAAGYDRARPVPGSTPGSKHAARLLARVAVACFDEGITQWFADSDPTHPGLEYHFQQTHAELSALLHATR